MNFTPKNLVAGATFALLTLLGCSTPQGTREDYFGYNNKPVVEEEVAQPEKPQQAKQWQNPLSAPPRPAIVYYEPVFVPVTAPWWDRYYGWEDYNHSRVVVMYPHHRVRYYGWDYSYANYPYYAGYPYYGGYPYYDRPYYDRPDRDYPAYRDVEPVTEKKTSRRMGSSRGTVSPDTEKDSRGTDNSGWRVRGRGETTASPSSERTKEPTTAQPTSRSRSTGVTSRGSSSTSSSRKEEKESVSATSTSKKSESGTSKKSEPAKSETKETKSKVRGRGE